VENEIHCSVEAVLDVACAEGRLEVLIYLCENLAREGRVYINGMHWACISGHLNVVKYLVEKKPEIVQAANLENLIEFDNEVWRCYNTAKRNG
jgi:hypothetical protein